jgi:DNA-binding MarR family transcriptional regulator
MATSQTQPRTGEPMTSRPAVLLGLLGHHAMDLMREALSDCGLKPRQMEILEFLVHQDQVGQRELGDTLAIDHSILVTMLNPLESEGLIERRRSCTDRRRHFVMLTEAGRRRYAEAAARIEGVEQQLLGRLPAADRVRLAELLTALAAGELPAHGSDCEA